MFKKKKNWLGIIKIVFIILLVVTGVKLFSSLFNIKEVQQLIIQLGIWGPVIFILYCILAHVIAPLVGSPVFWASLAIYGARRTTIFYYLASLISATINFYISRKLGRPWVQRLGGKKTLKQIDRIIVDKLGDKILILCRLLGFSIFDVISYAAGFTQISYKRYILITAVFSPIPLIGLVAFFRNFQMTADMILLYIATMALIGAVFVLVMRRFLRE